MVRLRQFRTLLLIPIALCLAIAIVAETQFERSLAAIALVIFGVMRESMRPPPDSGAGVAKARVLKRRQN